MHEAKRELVRSWRVLLYRPRETDQFPVLSR